MKNNYPRFDVIVRDGTSPAEVMEMVETKAKNLLESLSRVNKHAQSTCFLTSDKVGETMDNDQEHLDGTQNMGTASDTDNFQSLSPVELEHILQMASDDD